MSQIKTLNGVQYTLPQYNDTAWGANTGNVLTQYLAAIADVTLQLSGGSFTLTADVDFGASFGLKALFLKSETTNPASAGVVRLAKTDSIKWRNNANGADIALTIDGSDNLTFASNKVYTAGGAAGIVNADIASGAAIAYSKLALTGSILNADINSAAAIAYSKLALTGSILNADINASAAIAYSKLTLTGSVVNADIGASAAIAYSKLSLTGSILNADINASAAIARSKLDFGSGLVNADIASAAAIAVNKLAALTVSRVLVSDGSGFLAVATTTATEIGFVNGVTSAIQTQITGKRATFANGQLPGTATNDAATAGNVGERISSTSGSVNLATSAQWVDVTSITLTAGDWDISGVTFVDRNTALQTQFTNYEMGISATSGNSSTGLVDGDNHLYCNEGTTGLTNAALTIPVYQALLTGSVTYYLKVKGSYSGGQPVTVGRITARRVR